MAPFKDHTVTIEFTVTREYSYSESADVVAQTLGISVAKLRRIVAGDDTLEPRSLADLIDASDVLADEEFEVDSVEAEDEG